MTREVGGRERKEQGGGTGEGDREGQKGRDGSGRNLRDPTPEAREGSRKVMAYRQAQQMKARWVAGRIGGTGRTGAGEGGRSRDRVG
jgi:hypothetical protein